jgi:hypothetical protein
MRARAAAAVAAPRARAAGHAVRRALHRAAVVALVLPLAACLRGRARTDYAVSSERSDYSPVVRLDVRVALDDSVRVTVGGGSVLAPGEPGARAAAIMRDLVVSALVVRATAEGDDTGGPPRPWTSVAESAPHPLVDSLALGVARPVPPMRFVLERPPDLDPRRSWLVFRIRGATLTTPLTLADGTPVPVQTIRDGVRVYACAERSLAGRVDRGRARQLRAAYASAC